MPWLLPSALLPLLAGVLCARGRRTVTAWLRTPAAPPTSAAK